MAMNKCERILMCVFAVAALALVSFESSVAGPPSPEDAVVNEMMVCAARMDSICLNQASAKLMALSSKAGSKYTPAEADELIWNNEYQLMNNKLMLCTKQKNLQCMGDLQRQLAERILSRCLLVATRFECPVTSTDKDGDGIADAEEDRLLARFSPYYRFTRDHGAEEHYNPTDPIWAIRHSELQKGADENATPLIPKDCSGNKRICLSQDPKQLVFGGAHCHLTPRWVMPAKNVFGAVPRLEERVGFPDLWKTPERSNCRLNIFNDFRKGADWKDILNTKNVGLFGHVVPIVDKKNPCSLCGKNTNKPKCKYSIEYYTFYAYNNAAAYWDIADHEGDWTYLTVIYDPNTDKIERVSHWVHGGMISFNMAASRSWVVLEVGKVKEYRGPNCCKYPPEIKLHGDPPPQMHDHILRMYLDPKTREYSHPVSYIEYGTHENWPSDIWSYQWAPKHTGNSYHYLSANPPNLGEVEHPRGDHAEIILRFNGRWGGWGRKANPPPGPTLHRSWIWPAGSKLRCRIPESSFQN
jgi:hypothetical protein